MSCGNASVINQTFILEAAETGDSVTITACTGVHTNEIISCSGDTSLTMGSGTSIFSHSVLINGSVTATTVSATTIISDSSLKPKSGIIAGISFSGNPKTSDVIFGTPYISSGYTINITGGASRSFTFENITISGFTINANANTAFAENVHWKTSLIGEEL